MPSPEIRYRTGTCLECLEITVLKTKSYSWLIATLPEIREDLSAGWMASSEAEGSGTPLLDPDSCRDRICRDPTPGDASS
jgi:hypothetical protein